jgi:Predicted membrane protein (DUF2306)
MARAAQEIEPAQQTSWKKGVSWLLALTAIFFAARFFVFSAGHYFIDFSPTSYGEYWPKRGFLLMHIIGGSLALLAGPFQVWSGLRRRVLKWHRGIGMTYLGGVLIGSAGAYCLSAISQIRTFAIALSTLATVWLVTSAMAFIAIKKRRMEIHKEWMIRSYVITYAFVIFRLLGESGVFAYQGVEQYTTTAWLCWTLPLFFTEVLFQWKRLALR